jgi:trimeric autotransporter adhesin
MAYQPKSYRKFLAGTITAAVVASAVAPAASAAEVKFTDLAGVSAETLTAIEALVGLNVIVGFPDGTFKPNQPINNSQAAEMIVKFLPNVDPKAAPTGKVFEDLTEKSYASKFAEALVDAGLIPAGGKFNATAGITREAMAVVAVKAFGLKDTGKEVEIKDLDKASEAARASIKILAQHNLTNLLEGNFRPTETVTRSQFALFFYRGVQAVTATTPEVTGAVATGSKKIEVSFKSAVVDTTKATFEVKKGSSVINVSTSTFNADKTKAVLEFPNNLTAGDYTVTVKGLSEKDLTATAKVESSKVTNIEVLATEAPIKADGTVTVGYKVTNQYGEDITTDVTVDEFDPNVTVNKTNKSITVSGLDLVSTTAAPEARTFTLVHSGTGLNKTVTVKATAASVLSEVEIKGVYNVDGKTLTEGTNLMTSADNYYLEVEAKDQYGNVLTAAQMQTGLYITESGAGVVDVTDTTNAPTVVEFSTKEGVKKAGIKLTTTVANPTTLAGSNLVTLVPSATGKAATYTIQVAAAAKVDTISLNVPSLIVANEDLLVPVTVTDTKGNNVKNAASVAVQTAVLGSTAGTFVNDKDGNLFLKFAKANVTQGTTTLLVVTQTGKAVSQLVEVKAAAVPTLIQSLNTDVSTAVYVDKTFTADDFIIKDQHGRTMTALNTGYTVGVKSEGIANTSTDNVLSFAGLTATAAKKGSEQVVFALYNGTTLVENSEKAVNLTVVEKSDFVSYGVDDVTALYADTSANGLQAYDKEVKAYGTTAAGLKVYLRAGDYNVVSNSAELVVDNSVVGKWIIDAADTPALENNTAKTAKLTVILNHTGAEIVKDVTVSNVAPSVEAVNYVTGTPATAVTSIEFDNAADQTFNAADVLANLVVTDSYGVKSTTVGSVFNGAVGVQRITFTKIVDKATATPITISGNGTSTAALSNLQDGDTFEAIVYVGGKTVTLTVAVK